MLGRFISPDTIVPEPGSSGGFNRYRYVRNNPLRYTDPTGHIECPGVNDCLEDFENDGGGGNDDIDPSDDWWDLGWDWLLQRGPEPRIFDESHYMTQQLMNDLGVSNARDAFYRNGLSQEEPYLHPFDFYEFSEASLQGKMTPHFLGGYRVTIEQVSDTELSFEVYNRTGLASGTRNPFNRDQTLLAGGPRSDLLLGGDYDQYYVWTEPIQESFTPPPTKVDPYIDIYREVSNLTSYEGLWNFLAP